ncbi:hypothetical protein [Chryseobacterium binzhouense]|uniref:hypothetical protein n=1 Tax=Chryseobacterium binzhouense TaxID=2593646 RepID=UPI00117EB3C7|nr:hypothetical protein [Chryseobacterium binzhouense]
MKKILLLFNFGMVLITQAQQNSSKIIKDSIFGKPKYVKEYVLFLNDSGPFTFMHGDDEYGHSVIMTPQNLRSRMSGTWFESDFCRYINNETYYDKNRNITKETWYYRSGDVVDDYDYTYDFLGRLINEKSTNKYSKTYKKYIYEGSSKKLKFTEYRSKWEDEPTKVYFINHEKYNPFIITKFDTLTKTDSVFAVTDFVWNKLGKNSFLEGKDSVFRKRLTQVNFYDNDLQIKESKSFSYRSDHYNKKLFQRGYTKYERDTLGRIIKETQINDDKYRYYILEKNGKYREEIIGGAFASISSTAYEYYDDGTLKTRKNFYQGNILNQIQFTYENNQIVKVLYLDAQGESKSDLKATEIVFKYKYDKYKNWTEVIKNVDGKDLYKWIRKIEYYE